MIKFKKDFNLNFIAVITGILLLFSNAVLYPCPSKDSLRVPVSQKTTFLRMQEVQEELYLLKQSNSNFTKTKDISVELNDYTKLLFEDRRLVNLVNEYIPVQAQAFVRKDPFVASIVCSQVAGNLLDKGKREEAEFIFTKVIKLLMMLKNNISMTDKYLEGYVLDLESRDDDRRDPYYEKRPDKYKLRYKLAEKYEVAIEEIADIVGLSGYKNNKRDKYSFPTKLVNQTFRETVILVTRNAIRSEKSKSDYINIIKDVFGDMHIEYLIEFGLLDEASKAIEKAEWREFHLHSLYLARLKNSTSSKEIIKLLDKLGGPQNVIYSLPEIAYLLVKNSSENELEYYRTEALKLFKASIDFAQSGIETSTGMEIMSYYGLLKNVYRFGEQAGVVDSLMQGYSELVWQRPKEKSPPAVVDASILDKKLRETISKFSSLNSYQNYEILSHTIQKSVDYVLTLDNELQRLKQALGSTSKTVRVSN